MTNQIRLAKEHDAEGILEIYSPFILNTSLTFETEVPSIAAFRERINAYLNNWPWLVCEMDGKIYSGLVLRTSAFGVRRISVLLAMLDTRSLAVKPSKAAICISQSINRSLGMKTGRVFIASTLVISLT